MTLYEMMPSTKVGSVGHRPTILIVDDQAPNIHLLNEMLKADCEVLFAKGGRQAVEVCAEHAPDLVLLDVMMPDIDGYRTCHLLKESDATRDIPVIFVTSCDSYEEESKGLHAGAVDFISKPVNPDVLRARVRTQLSLKRQTELLKELVFVDALTGLPNRRRFDEQFDRDFRACLRSQYSIAVLMLDIDYFKPFNDTHGHPAGDDLLRKLAQVLDRALRRPRDFIARYGGEEFVCVLPEVDLAGGRRCAEYLMQRISESELRHGASPISEYVTMSIGVAAMVPHGNIEAADLLRSADQNLYQAKERGRARVFDGRQETSAETVPAAIG